MSVQPPVYSNVSIRTLQRVCNAINGRPINGQIVTAHAAAHDFKKNPVKSFVNSALKYFGIDLYKGVIEDQDAITTKVLNALDSLVGDDSGQLNIFKIKDYAGNVRLCVLKKIADGQIGLYECKNTPIRSENLNCGSQEFGWIEPDMASMHVPEESMDDDAELWLIAILNPANVKDEDIQEIRADLQDNLIETRPSSTVEGVLIAPGSITEALKETALNDAANNEEIKEAFADSNENALTDSPKEEMGEPNVEQQTPLIETLPQSKVGMSSDTTNLDTETFDAQVSSGMSSLETNKLKCANETLAKVVDFDQKEKVLAASYVISNAKHCEQEDVDRALQVIKEIYEHAKLGTANEELLSRDCALVILKNKEYFSGDTYTSAAGYFLNNAAKYDTDVIQAFALDVHNESNRFTENIQGWAWTYITKNSKSFTKESVASAINSLFTKPSGFNNTKLGDNNSTSQDHKAQLDKATRKSCALAILQRSDFFVNGESSNLENYKWAMKYIVNNKTSFSTNVFGQAVRQIVTHADLYKGKIIRLCVPFVLNNPKHFTQEQIDLANTHLLKIELIFNNADAAYSEKVVKECALIIIENGDCFNKNVVNLAIDKLDKSENLPEVTLTKMASAVFNLNRSFFGMLIKKNEDFIKFFQDRKEEEVIANYYNGLADVIDSPANFQRKVVVLSSVSPDNQYVARQFGWASVENKYEFSMTFDQQKIKLTKFSTEENEFKQVISLENLLRKYGIGLATLADGKIARFIVDRRKDPALLAWNLR